MGRQQHDHFFADFDEQVVKARTLLRVEARGRLVDDDQLGVAEQRLRNAEALAHAAGKSAERFLAHIMQIGLAQQGVDHLAPLGAICEPLQPRQMIEQVFGADLRVDAEVLRQIAEHATHGVFVAKNVDAAGHVGELRRARVGVLQGRQRSHQGRLAGAIRPEQAEHAGGDRQRDVVERAHAVGIGLRQTGDVQLHGAGR